MRIQFGSEGDVPEKRTLYCAGCGRTGTERFRAVEHSAPMEPSDWDTECLDCGSLEVFDSAGDAMGLMASKLESLHDASNEKMHRLAEERDQWKRERDWLVNRAPDLPLVADPLGGLARTGSAITAKEHRHEQVLFRLLVAPCCKRLVRWLAPRLPTYCPECGTRIDLRYRAESIRLSDNDAWLTYHTD